MIAVAILNRSPLPHMVSKLRKWFRRYTYPLMALEKVCPLQIMENFDFQQISKHFHTMEVSKRLEVDFQQISIPWKCPKGWKYHGNLLEVAMISMIWRGHDFSSVSFCYNCILRCFLEHERIFKLLTIIVS